VEKISR